MPRLVMSLLVACSLSAATNAWSVTTQTMPVSLTAFVQSGEQFDIRLKADERLLCQLKHVSRTASPAPVQCQFELPINTKSLSIVGWHGEIETKVGLNRKPPSSQKWPLIDFSPLIDALVRSKAPLAQQLANYAQAEQALLRPLDEGPSLFLQPRRQDARPAIDEAERRLGYDLPADYQELISSYEAIRLADAWVVPPKQLGTIGSLLQQQPDPPAMDLLDRRLGELYKRATLLFRTVGPDLAGLAYLPASGRGCFATAAMYWVDQNALDAPDLQLNGKQCMTFSEALRRQIFDRGVQKLSQQAQAQGKLAIDRQATKLQLLLQFGSPDRFNPALSTYWAWQ